VIRRSLAIFALLATIAFAPAARADAPTSRPTNVDPATWQRMVGINDRGATITDLAADFEQQKFTAMLKKPLLSSGTVFVRGSAMLWDTKKPEPTALQITDREVRIYYPREKTIEVYQIEQKLGELAASPLPRLAVLQQHFSFEPIPVVDMGEKDAAKFFAVKMKPIDAELRTHVQQVRVLLEVERGLIVRFEMLDADGDRTLITFSNVKTNIGLKDEQLKIAAPADVKVTRPLAAIESGAESRPETRPGDQK
jgi:outer membrane lipoprotein-sorting protein